MSDTGKVTFYEPSVPGKTYYLDEDGSAEVVDNETGESLHIAPGGGTRIVNTADTLAGWPDVGVYECCTGLLIDDLDLINDHDLIHDGVNILVWSTRDDEYDYAVSIASTATGPTSPPRPAWHYPSLAECVTLVVLVSVLVLKRRVVRWIKENTVERDR